MKLREGNVFTGVCSRGWGGLSLVLCLSRGGSCYLGVGMSMGDWVCPWVGGYVQGVGMPKGVCQRLSTHPSPVMGPIP